MSTAAPGEAATKQKRRPRNRKPRRDAAGPIIETSIRQPRRDANASVPSSPPSNAVPQPTPESQVATKPYPASSAPAAPQAVQAIDSTQVTIPVAQPAETPTGDNND